jgi:hypothetical protein
MLPRATMPRLLGVTSCRATASEFVARSRALNVVARAGTHNCRCWLRKGLGLQRDLTSASAAMGPGSRPGRREFLLQIPSSGLTGRSSKRRLRFIRFILGASLEYWIAAFADDDEWKSCATPQPSLRAKRSNPSCSSARRKMDCFVARAPRNDGETHFDGETHLRILAARFARGLQEISAPKIRGRGECRAPMHPQPRVQSRKHTSVVTTGPPV